MTFVAPTLFEATTSASCAVHQSHGSRCMDDTLIIASSLQYVEFLSTALSPEAYCTILPSITELVQKYQLDIEVALQVLHSQMLAMCH